jgi:hypothetical protein
VTGGALRRTMATVVAAATSRTRTIPVVSLDLGVSLDPGVCLEFIRAATRYRCGLVALLS